MKRATACWLFHLQRYSVFTRPPAPPLSVGEHDAHVRIPSLREEYDDANNWWEIYARRFGDLLFFRFGCVRGIYSTFCYFATSSPLVAAPVVSHLRPP